MENILCFNGLQLLLLFNTYSAELPILATPSQDYTKPPAKAWRTTALALLPFYHPCRCFCRTTAADCFCYNPSRPCSLLLLLSLSTAGMNGKISTSIPTHAHSHTHTHFRFMPVFFSIRIQRGEGRETKLRSIRSIDRWNIETFSYRFANTSCRNTPGSIGDAPTHRTRIVLLCGANYYSPHPLLFLFTPSTTAQPPFFCCCAPTECETFLFKRKVYHCIFLSNCTTPSPSLLHQARGCDRAVR